EETAHEALTAFVFRRLKDAAEIESVRAVVRIDAITLLPVIQIDHYITGPPIPTRVTRESVRACELEVIGEPLIHFKVQTCITEIGRRLENRESSDRTLSVRIIPLRDRSA